MQGDKIRCAHEALLAHWSVVIVSRKITVHCLGCQVIKPLMENKYNLLKVSHYVESEAISMYCYTLGIGGKFLKL